MSFQNWVRRGGVGQTNVGPSTIGGASDRGVEGEVSSRVAAQEEVPPAEGVATSAGNEGDGTAIPERGAEVEIIGSSRGAGSVPKEGMSSRLRTKRSTPPPPESSTRKKKKTNKSSAPKSKRVPGMTMPSVLFFGSDIVISFIIVGYIHRGV